MTAIPQSTTSRFTSQRIIDPLRAVATRQWKIAAARGALRALLWSQLAVLAGSLLLGFLPAPAWLRLSVAAVTWAAVLATVIHHLRPALRRRSLTDAAFTVEQRTPGLAERISSAVELSGEHEAFSAYPTLMLPLVRQSEADPAAVRADAIVPADKVRRSALLLAPA